MCSGEGNGNPLQYSCLENPTDRGRPWGRKEAGTTEQLTANVLCRSGLKLLANVTVSKNA